MEQMNKSVVAITAFAVLAGCGTRPQPVVDNRAEALRAIQAAEGAAIRAFGKRDAVQSASMYAPDATLMLTNAPSVKGAEIGPLLKEMMVDPNFTMTFHTAKVEAPRSGEFGYTRGTYTMTMTDSKSNKILRESGKYLTVYARQADGSWKIVDDINNPDAPASPADLTK
jgi:ketosteroid isomerase-like protein